MSPDLLSAHGSAALILMPLQCLLTHTHTHLVYSPVSSLRNCRLVLSTFKPSCCPVLLSQLPLSPRQRDAGKKEAGAPFGYGRAICFLLIRYDRVEPLRNRQEQQSMENNSAGTQCCAAYCGLSCGCCVHSLRLQAGIMACIQGSEGWCSVRAAVIAAFPSLPFMMCSFFPALCSTTAGRLLAAGLDWMIDI